MPRKEKKSVKREFSAGGVVYNRVKEQESGRVKTLWLIIQPKRDKDDKPIHWRLPKGIIEDNEPSAQTALREVEEEAGAKAKIIDKIGRTTYFYTFKGERIFKIIVFYLMRFLAETGAGPDAIETEKTEWLTYKKAYEQLTFKSEKEILAKARKILKEKGRQQSLF